MSDETPTPPPLVLTCPCGKTKIQSTAPTMGAGICHCNACRVLCQGIAFEGAVWPGGSFEPIQGTIESRKRPDIEMTVHSCKDCNCMLYHTEIHNLDIVASSEIRRCNNGKLPEHYKPAFHCWYKNRVFDIMDDLPKMADSSMGGTGQMMTNDGTLIIEEEATKE